MNATERPAYYAFGTGRGGIGDWLTLLHPPYTAWHLSYVAIGAALARHFSTWRLAGTLVAFFLAVGIGAHALDELAGRPLQTGIPSAYLYVASALGVGIPVVTGLVWGGLRLLPFVVVGSLLAITYNLELLNGALHRPIVFALGWGAFPVVTGFYVQEWDLSWSVLPAAAGAFFLSAAQHALSRPARVLRRQAVDVTGSVVLSTDRSLPLDRATLVAPLERALQTTATGVVCVAVALVVARL